MAVRLAGVCGGWESAVTSPFSLTAPGFAQRGGRAAAVAPRHALRPHVRKAFKSGSVFLDATPFSRAVRW